MKQKMAIERLLHSLAGKRVVIMGLGLHGGGTAAARWAAQHKARVLVTDLRTRKELAPSLKALKRYKGITYVLGKHRVADFRTADLIIKNPSVPPNSHFLSVAQQAGVPVENEVSLFFRLTKAPVVAVTGTKGKSTTTVLIHQILRAARQRPLMAGNIRVSPLDIVSRTDRRHPVVLELSSWQIEDAAHVRIRPHIAVMTNLLRDHLNRHRTMQQYSRAKAKLFSHQTAEDVAVLNHDNTYTRQIGRQVPGRRIWFSDRYIGEENAVYVKNKAIIERWNGHERQLLPLSAIGLAGRHNVQNVLAACAAVAPYTIPARVLQKTIREFPGVPGRLERVRTLHRVDYYNDTTATMPDAAIAALQSFQSKVILIAGGTDKNLDFRKLTQVIPRRTAVTILLPGTATEKIALALERKKYKHMCTAKSMNEAVRLAQAEAEKRHVTTVLLSPGAASFGLFSHEFDRGDQFIAAVKKLT